MDNDATKLKIGQTRDYLLASNLSEEAKDGLLDQLNAAATAINGTQDKIGALCILVAQRTCAEIRQAVRLPAMMDDAIATGIKAHASACKFTQQQPSKPAMTGKLAIALAFCQSWPLMIALAIALVFSPNIPKLAELAERLLK